MAFLGDASDLIATDVNAAPDAFYWTTSIVAPSDASHALGYAEDQAERNIPMTMKDWAGKLNAFLQFNERDILDHPGKVSQEMAKAFAESEFEKYRIVQDRLFESDFDRHIKQVLEAKTQSQISIEKKSSPAKGKKKT